MKSTTDHFKHHAHVLFKREDLDGERLEGKIVVVLDVLFATTTIIHALKSGATEVIPTINEESARAEAAKYEPHNCILAGELYANTLPGFSHPSPLRLAQESLEGKKVIYSTTNGTVALKQSVGAEQIYVGALINAEAVVNHILDHHREKQLLIVCSGSMGNPNIEDICGAGYFIKLIKSKLQGDKPGFYSDAGECALSFFNSEPSHSLLLRSRVGQLMVARNMTDEVRFAANLSTHALVPQVNDGIVSVVGW